MRAQGESRTAYIGASRAGHSPVIGVEGLLALVSAVQRWRRDAQAGEDSGPWCQQMQSCPPFSGFAGRSAAVGGVPGDEPGARGAPAELAGRADDGAGGACEWQGRG